MPPPSSSLQLQLILLRDEKNMKTLSSHVNLISAADPAFPSNPRDEQFRDRILQKAGPYIDRVLDYIDGKVASDWKLLVEELLRIILELALREETPLSHASIPSLGDPAIASPDRGDSRAYSPSSQYYTHPDLTGEEAWAPLFWKHQWVQYNDGPSNDNKWDCPWQGYHANILSPVSLDSLSCKGAMISQGQIGSGYPLRLGNTPPQTRLSTDHHDHACHVEKRSTGGLGGGSHYNRKHTDSIGKIALGAAACLALGAQPLFAAAAEQPLRSVLSHIAAGTSIASSISILPLRNGGDIVLPEYWIAMVYTLWGISFGVLLACEILRRRPSQRKLLIGTVLFASLNLLGALTQSAPSTLEGVMCWGPMALTVSLFAIPVIMDSVGPRDEEVSRTAAAFTGVHIPRESGEVTVDQKK